ncbi:MAG: FkbM family methyltransferase [Chitinophagaceae bacterium]
MSFLKNIGQGIKKRISSLFKNPYKEVNLNRYKLTIYKHLSAGKLRKHRLEGKYIYFYRPIEFLHGLKEIFIDKIYFQQLPKNAYIIDCGANIGLSVIYLKKIAPEASIIAFEPDDKNFELLQKNINSFNFKNVTLKKEAVWVENTVLNFLNDASMSSKVDENNSPSSIKVQASRLKDLLKKKIDFLKIDIEGAEYKVLCDIEENLYNVDKLFLEYHGKFHEQNELTHIFSILSKNGFKYYIKEAASLYNQPFYKRKEELTYDIQLNIFCFRS